MESLLSWLRARRSQACGKGREYKSYLLRPRRALAEIPGYGEERGVEWEPERHVLPLAFTALESHRKDKRR